jgi:hypothetical protein
MTLMYFTPGEVATLLAAKDAEIERLREENAHFAWRNADKNKLITELCDALEKYVEIPSLKCEALLRRARREAT